MNHCECQEEGTRNVVAECLGKLTLVNAEELLPKLKKYLSSESALIRSTVVTAIKFTISDQVGGSTGLDMCICGIVGLLYSIEIVTLVCLNTKRCEKSQS